MSGILGGLIGSVSKKLFWSTGTTASLNYYATAFAPNFATDKYFAAGAGATITTTTNNYSVSTDGITWTTKTFPASALYRASAYNGSRLVIAGYNNSSFYTDNGTTWTSTQPFSSTGTVPTEGLWDGTNFVFVSTADTTDGLAYSTNGTSWTRYDVGNGAAAIGRSPDGRYIVMTTGTTATHRTSTSAISAGAGSWSNITLPSSQTWTSIKWANSIWVATTNASTTYATSTDGTTWTSRTLPSAVGESRAGTRPKVAVFNNRFYFLGVDENIYSSGDGINWIIEQSLANNLAFVLSWIESPNALIGFGAVEGGGAISQFIRGA